MKDGDKCEFIVGDMAVSCRCYISGIDGKKAYGVTIYEVNDYEEYHQVFHAGRGRKIESYSEAVEVIRNFNEFRSEE